MTDLAVYWWKEVSGGELAQGDLFPNCRIPVLSLKPNTSAEAPLEQGSVTADFIVVTQTCDLANNRAQFVALCPIYSLSKFEIVNPEYSRKGKWEGVRKGRVEALHLLASPQYPKDNRQAHVADFGHIVSVPVEYLARHAEAVGTRWRLQSPFLEHFSQSFARFFMRVGLPADIPPFK